MTTTYRPSAIRVVRDFLHASRAPRIGKLREFAEREIILGEGPCAGLAFSCSRNPWTRLWFDAIDSGHWRRFLLTGPVQSGKTLCGYVIPAVWHLYEWSESAILGVPHMKMAYDKWRLEISPTIDARPRFYRELPERGRGSKGGQFESVRFRHGPELRFMSGAGGDENRSGYTARVALVTEADRVDEAGETSDEAAPIFQIENRTASEGENARFYAECTCTTPDGYISRERKTNSTRSEIHCPCYHCERFLVWGREHLVGLDAAANEVEAAELAAWECPHCRALIDDDERRTMNEQGVLVHRGQHVTKKGQVEGRLPPTRTLGFRYSAFNNLFVPTSLLGEKEWRAARAAAEETFEADDLEKQQCQTVWAVPYTPPDLGDIRLDAEVIRERTDRWVRDVVPADTEHLAMGVDLGGHTCWWVLLAFRRTGEVHVVAYGAFAVEVDDDTVLELGLLESLRGFRDSIVEVGFPVEGSDQRRLPETVWIDCGWMTDVVAGFVRESGPLRANRYMPCRGRGKSQVNPSRYAHRRRSKTVRASGEEFYIELNQDRRVIEATFNADYWKLKIQSMLSVEPGQPGAITFYEATQKHERQHEHGRVSRHLSNEWLEKQLVAGRGVVEVWQKHGQNHWLDAFAMAGAGGSFCGYEVAARVVRRGMLGGKNTHEPKPPASACGYENDVNLGREPEVRNPNSDKWWGGKKRKGRK